MQTGKCMVKGNHGSSSLQKSILHGPIMMLEVLSIIKGAKDEQSGRRQVIDFINNSQRDIKPDTNSILLARGYTKEEIPKLVM